MFVIYLHLQINFIVGNPKPTNQPTTRQQQRTCTSRGRNSCAAAFSKEEAVWLATVNHGDGIGAVSQRANAMCSMTPVSHFVRFRIRREHMPARP